MALAGLNAGRACADDLSNVLGVTHIDGKYYFGNEDYLNQGADEVLATGSKLIKVEMDSQIAAKYPWNSTWPVPTSLTNLAQTGYFKSLFSKPFNTYVITAYSIGIPGGGDGTEYWLNGMTAAQKAAEQQSFYDLARYLMTTYNGTGKTFLLENWEGDWALRDGAGNTGTHNGTPSPTNVQGMIDWFNAREAGIRQARAELGATSNVKVYGTVEVNLVKDAMDPTYTRATVTNNVLPFTNVDFASYSSYDTQATSEFPVAINYIASHLPASALNGRNTHSVYVGEFGEPEGQKTASQVNATINNVLSTVQADGMPYALYWEIYSNELQNGATPPVNGNNAGVKGFYLVRPDGTPATAWPQYRERLITSDPNRATTGPIIAASHEVYQSAFPSSAGATSTLGPGWTTATFGGDFSVTAGSGVVDMQVVNNAAAFPFGLATLDIPVVAGKGLSPGDYLQFTLHRQNDAGIIGVAAFGLHHGSGANSGPSPLNVFSDNTWTPFSFAPGGAATSYDWDIPHTLGVRLDSADGTFATISYYLDGSYSGSWLYPTAATTLDSIGLFAQSDVLNSGFQFGDVQARFVHPVLPGDTNADGKVDFTDLVALARHYGSSAATWQEGDFNADGTVGFDDLVLLARDYGQGISPAQVSQLDPAFQAAAQRAFAQVPEPDSACPLAFATMVALRRKRSSS